MKPSIVWHKAAVSKEDRRQINGHGSAVLWFTGLSGSGKSTLANATDRYLSRLGVNSCVLDGDNIRHGLNRDLGFTEADRKENIRRIGEVAKLFVNSGQFALTALISPYRKDREAVRRMLDEGDFIEIYVKCSLDECKRRDPKGLYQRAMRERSLNSPASVLPMRSRCPRNWCWIRSGGVSKILLTGFWNGCKNGI